MLGRLPGTNVFRNVKQYPEAQQYPGILAVRIDAPLYYANVPVSITVACLSASSLTGTFVALKTVERFICLKGG